MSGFADPGSRALPGPGTPVVVVGLGVSGEAAVRHLLQAGARVTVADAADTPALRERAARLAGARVLLGSEDPALCDGASLVIASPGVPPAAPPLVAARTAGVPVWSEVELASRMSPVPLLGVTGTNGKTTAAGMLAACLTASGLRVATAGNIGRPLTDAVAGARDRLDAVVAELSSFQLEGVVSLRVRVAVLLNLAPDHLDWHGTVEAYAAAKARIFANQRPEDTAVVHVSLADPAAWGVAARLVPFAARRPPGGAGIEDGWITVPEGRAVEVRRLRVHGRGNLENATAAAAAACAFGVAPQTAGEALTAFAPPPHRCEPVGEFNGVAYVNDSKATNPHAALAAIADLDRVVLICGGRNRSGDLASLTAAAPRLRHVVAIGEAAGEIAEVLEPAGVPVSRSASMREAVASAAAAAHRGDTVLLSPACASLDMFESYVARGEAFRAEVARLREGSAPARPARASQGGSGRTEGPA